MAVLSSRPTISGTGLSPFQTAAKASTMDPLTATLGIGSILANLFGNIFGAKTQARTAERTTQAQIEAANRAAELEAAWMNRSQDYLERIDARDYADWLQREARDRGDWEASEQRRAPYRALGDSAIRTLADYIAVPGMQPTQEVPVQRWSAGAPSSGATGPTSNTLPVGGDTQQLTSAYLAQTPTASPGSFKDFLPGYQAYMQDQGYQVDFMDHPTKHDKVTITGPDGRSQIVDMVVGAGGDNPQWGWMVEGGGGGAASGGSASASRGGWRNTSSPESLLAKYGRRSTLRDLMPARMA